MHYDYHKDETLQKIQQIIVQNAKSDKIIWFGSRVRRAISENSDYDIMIIKDNLKNERTLTKKINHALLDGHLNAAIPVLLDAMEKISEIPGSSRDYLKPYRHGSGNTNKSFYLCKE